jgi:GTPase SAR1 family protein
MLVGQGRAGKTAVANNMMGKWFQGNTSSTMGTDKFDRKVVCGNIDKSQSVLKEYMRPAKELEQIITSVRPLVPHAKDDTAGGKTRDDIGSSMTEEKAAELFAELSTEDVSISSTAKETVSKRLTVSDIDCAVVQQYSENISADSELIISLYDFGGQDIFNVLHPFFMSKYGVYVVVFDMELFVSKEKEKRDSCMRHLMFWMNSIVMHTYDQKSGKTAPVAIVGTRKDKVSRTEDHKQISKVLSALFSSCPIWLSLLHDSNSMNFFPVNNNKWFFMCDTVRHLLDSIVNQLENADFVKKPVSLLWIKILDEMKAKNTSFLGISEVEEMSKVYSLSSNEIAEMLTFFYEMGILIWINQEKLRDIVILDPIEYFVKPATMIICKHIATKDDPYHTVHCENVHKACREEWPEEWFQMLEFGLVSERLAKRLLASVCNDMNHIDKVLFLMERYGLLSLLLPITQNQLCTGVFFVPSVAPDDPDNYCFTEEYSLLLSGLNLKRARCLNGFESVVFHFGFSVSPKLLRSPLLSANDLAVGGFLPNGIFARFIGRLFGAIVNKFSDVSLRDFLDRNNFIAFKDMVKLQYKSRVVKITNLLQYNMIRIEVQENHDTSAKKGEILGIHDSLCEILQPLISECGMSLAVVTLLPVHLSDFLKHPMLPLSELFSIIADTKHSIDYDSLDRTQSFNCSVTEVKTLYKEWLEVSSVHPMNSKLINKVGLFPCALTI